jgi:hypothetical protein
VPITQRVSEETFKWGKAYADWIETTMMYNETRSDGEYFPGELAQAELEAAIAVEDAWAECQR